MTKKRQVWKRREAQTLETRRQVGKKKKKNPRFNKGVSQKYGIYNHGITNFTYVFGLLGELWN